MDRAECLVGLLRVLWRRLADPSALLHSDLVLAETRICDLLEVESPRSSAELCKSIVGGWIRIACDLHTDHWTFAQLSAAMLPGLPLREARYFAMRAVRRQYGLLRTAETARRVHAFAADVTRLRRQSLFSPPRLESAIVSVAQHSPASRVESLVSLGSEALLDTCLVLDLLQFDPGAGIRLRPECEDPDYLLGHIFGMPSRIPGFDTLLGGGGLVLADAEVGSREGSGDDPIGGRVVLCAGPFGSGKSLLALQLAVDVARKGGIAWFMAMEQSAEECLYALESLGISTEEPSVFRVVHGNLSDSYLTLTSPSRDLGALVFLRPGPEPGDYAKFLENAGTHLRWMSEYPLRLLVVDPVNAFIQPDASAVEMRYRTRRLFEQAKLERVNIIFTSEQSSSDQDGAHGFEENIADSVIRLSIEHAHGQTQRYIEVTKSRMQRQFPGRHAVTIQSPGGFHVYPSSAFFARPAPSRALLPRRMPIGFGVATLDGCIGPESLTSGDIAVISGAAESAVLGAHFLLAASSTDPPQRAIFVTDLSADRARAFLSPFKGNQSLSTVEICAVPTGYVDPGMVLLRIQQALEHRHSVGSLRVLIGNLAHWPDAIPLIAGDPTFGVALLELIRNHSATTVLVAGSPSTSSAPLVETLANGADTVLQLTSIEFRGKLTTFLRTAKTRLMQHPRDSFALTVGPDEVRLSPSRLLRVDAGGQVHPVPISLFLHAETPQHRIRNQRMIDALRAAISPVSELYAQDRHFDAGLLPLAPRSAVDELQILQVDEFQIPGAPSSLTPADALFSVTPPQGGGPLQDRLPKLVDLVTQCDGESFVAVPFYLNISLLAIYLPRFCEISGSNVPPQTWEELASLGNSWEAKNPPEEELFFSCPIHESSLETYNCLFFEILHSLKPPGTAEHEDIAQWFASPQAVEAGILFHYLCRRQHAFKANLGAGRAVVSRQWFNTLSQQLSECTPDSRSGFAVCPLFGDITTAGEWYLSVPAYSAAPEVGMQLIEAMTSPDREIEGVESGVGLPTRAAYYTSDAQASVSRHFTLSRSEAHRLWSKGIRRSEFVMYHRSAAPISSHLVSILELLPGPNLRHEVKKVLESLIASLRFLRSSA